MGVDNVSLRRAVIFYFKTMAKTKIQKQTIVRDLQEKLKRAKSVVFARFNALGVADNEALRRDLKQEASEYYVAKKTLLAKTFADQKLDGFDPKSEAGQLAVVFGYEDEVAPAKILNKFIKGNGNAERLSFLGGVLEGKFIDAAQVKFLADLPSREELYAKVVGSINAPVSGFVNVLAGNLRGLVNVLHAIQEKKS